MRWILIVLVASWFPDTPGTEIRAASMAANDSFDPRSPLSPLPPPAFDRDAAAHLLRRAGFGGSPHQIDYLLSLGLHEAVDTLVDYESIDAEDSPYPHNPDDVLDMQEKLENSKDLAEIRRLKKNLRRVNEVHLDGSRRWWMRRLMTSPRVLEEKMTLFWHGHFPSGYPKVGWLALYRQNQMFRRHALAGFDDILRHISRDPAMITYLDIASNVVGHANENYARELLELFTLGAGHYTEKDIREIARAYTGFGLTARGEFRYHEELHDEGEKMIFGQTGRFGGDDVVELILARPQCARHLAERLLRFFASDRPDQGVIEDFAAEIRRHDYGVRESLRTLFKSRYFYSDPVRHNGIKSPVDLLVGTVRALEIPGVNPAGMQVLATAMGQDLLRPPSVKGWDGGRDWITASTLAVRQQVAWRFLGSENPSSLRLSQSMGRMSRGRDLHAMMNEAMAQPTMSELRHALLVPRAYDPRPVIERYRLDSSEKIVDHFVDRLLQQNISDDRRTVLLASMRQVVDGDPEAEGDRRAAKARALIALILSMPEYQVL